MIAEDVSVVTVRSRDGINDMGEPEWCQEPTQSEPTQCQAFTSLVAQRPNGSQGSCTANSVGVVLYLATNAPPNLGARARLLGADHGINYKTHPDWEREVLRLTAGRGSMW